jgi:hypothetical protein
VHAVVLRVVALDLVDLDAADVGERADLELEEVVEIRWPLR